MREESSQVSADSDLGSCETCLEEWSDSSEEVETISDDHHSVATANVEDSEHRRRHEHRFRLQEEPAYRQRIEGVEKVIKEDANIEDSIRAIDEHEYRSFHELSYQRQHIIDYQRHYK